MDKVNKYHHEIIITKHGKTAVKLAPINEAEKRPNIWLHGKISRYHREYYFNT